ncbi:hypothetical protein Fot_17653 [Forsythia ovata]|uniref:Uncharacterized protein n=1 Tax=Forsythia ovata TaxID=205694 RepID=A0ABD1VFY8_9LAMI
MLEDRLNLLALGEKEDFTGYGGNGGYVGGVFNVSLDVALGENHSENAPQGSFLDENSVAGDLSWNSLNRVEQQLDGVTAAILRAPKAAHHHFDIFFSVGEMQIGSLVNGVEKDGKRVYGGVLSFFFFLLDRVIFVKWL